MHQSSVADHVQKIIELARRHLQMDVAFVAEFACGRQVYRAFDGAGESFGLVTGEGPALGDAYCPRVMSGELPNAIPDTRADPRVRALATTAVHGIGSYIGVPIHLPDGTLYGSFCCLSHGRHDLNDRDVGFMRMLGELVASEVQAVRASEDRRRRMAGLIQDRRVQIVLQPIFQLQDAACLGVEALSRFPAGFGDPESVFRAAHEAGLGVPLEQLAIDEARSTLPFLASDQFLSVNLTPDAAYALAEAPPAHPEILPSLVLEITEHAAVASYAKLRERLRKYRREGLRLAIDDVGAGYASLKHIVELEPDLIKIDRSLVHGAANDRARRSAISAFVLLALEMGATVVAEGVERESDLSTMRDLGVDAAQGYLLGRPTANRRALTRWATGDATRRVSARLGI